MYSVVLTLCINCCVWNVSVNVSKTNIIIFSKGIARKYPQFSLGGIQVDGYMYLWATLNYTGRYTEAQKEN